MDRNTFIEKLLDRAQQAGFAAGEAYLSEGNSFEVSVDRGEITDYSVADSLNLGFRGLYNGRMGCASTQVLDEDAIEMLVSAAKASAELSETEDEEFIFEGSESYPELPAGCEDYKNLTAADKIEMARMLEQKALDHDPRIAPFNGTTVLSESGRTLLVNSRGLRLSSEGGLMGAYIAPIAKDGDKTALGMHYAFSGDPKKIDVNALAAKACDEALSMLDAESVPSGKYRILLRSDVAFTLLKTFASIFSADAAQKGMSLLKDREGEEIASACLSLADDPLLPDSAASRRFDGEGVAARKKLVIENGKLTTLLHNLKTAKKQGVETTGNAARVSCAGPMTVAPSNFYFVPGKLSRDEMIEKTASGLMITDLMGMHAGANAVSGDFSLGAKGYLIEGGRVVRPVNQITLAGNYLELLKNIEAAGADLEFGMPGGSRFGSPSLLVKELSVAGK